MGLCELWAGAAVQRHWAPVPARPVAAAAYRLARENNKRGLTTLSLRATAADRGGYAGAKLSRCQPGD